MNLSPIRFSKLLSLYLSLLLSLSSCKEDEIPPHVSIPIDYGYATTIISPAENRKYSLGDTLPISVHFSSETGEIVHFISVDIYNKTNKDVSLYSVESHQHIPDFFEYLDNFVIKDTSKIETGEDWILKTAMWSHEIMPDTVSLLQEFRIE